MTNHQIGIEWYYWRFPTRKIPSGDWWHWRTRTKEWKTPAREQKVISLSVSLYTVKFSSFKTIITFLSFREGKAKIIGTLCINILYVHIESYFLGCMHNFDPCNVDFSPHFKIDAITRNTVHQNQAGRCEFYPWLRTWTQSTGQYTSIMLFHWKDCYCEWEKTDPSPVKFWNALTQQRKPYCISDCVLVLDLSLFHVHLCFFLSFNFSWGDIHVLCMKTLETSFLHISKLLALKVHIKTHCCTSHY